MGAVRLTIAAAAIGAIPASVSAHLLITEITTTPTSSEFVEIHNPDASAVSLDDYYLSDRVYGGAPEYADVVLGSGALQPVSSDFLARFPAGSSIGPNETVIVAVSGGDFKGDFPGITPNFEIHNTDAGVDDMTDVDGLIGTSDALLSNAGEVVVLFHWDGASDLVQDVDIALWGDKAEAVDKTGISKDGPDGDSDPTTYQDDTSADAQTVILDDAHPFGESYQRVDCNEMSESSSGGNGISGDDETSEDLSHWTSATPGPGNPPASGDCGSVSVQNISWSQLKARHINQ